MSQSFRDSISFKATIIAATYVIVAGFELFVHWYMSSGYPLSGGLAHWYFYHDPQSGKGNAGDLDLMLPAILLGMAGGLVGWRWSIRRLALVVIICGIGIVSLEPIYRLVLSGRHFWWWPKTSSGLTTFMVWEIIKALLVLGVLTYGGCCFGEYFHHHARREGYDA